MKLILGAKTDVGRVRQVNEDSYLAEDPLFVIADGMGGHLAGDVASSLAVEVIIKNRDDNLANDPDRLKEILREANRTIWEKAESDSSVRGMGTTCTMVLFKDGTAHFAHVGDSRAYLFRDGRLEQVTEDHTLVERMVREGRLTGEEAARHPQRNIITNALGIDSEVEVDMFSIQLQEGNRLIICSDGLSSMVDHADLQSILAEGADPQTTAEKLVEAALDAGGEDNITVIVLDATEGEGVETPAVSTAAPKPERADTEPEAPSGGGGGGGKVLRRLLFAVLALALVAGAAYFAMRYTLSNSWFVGVSDEGFVTIFRGIPEEIAGLELKETEQETQIALTDLPGFMRSDIKQGQKVDSLDDAETTVQNLRERAQDEDLQRTRNTRKNNKEAGTNQP